jgi:multidrug efflux pump subunit AcrA (membrane-fusion protein)
MKKLRGVLKERKMYIAGAVVLLGAVAYFIFGRGSNKTEEFVVKRGNVTQSVLLSGEVQTSARADLGFAAAGRVSRVFVKNNQQVNRGTVLAQLEIGDLLADLKIKEANLRSSNTDLSLAVESAYRKMLSTDLVLTPDADNYTVDAPTISGLYDGAQEGQYKIIIDRDNPTKIDYNLRTFGLESTQTIISKKSGSPLGTHGLYINFPGNDPSSYEDTIWFLDIPNKKSSSYVERYNSYLEAKRERDAANSQGGSTATSEAAQGEIDKINAEIRKNTIYAPFTGKVTNIEKEVGENASVGERVISILGEEKLEVVLKVSELDVSRIKSDTQIEITLDAFPDETFSGTLTTVNSRDTTIDGVPVYEAFVELPADPRIKTGMSAKAKIIVQEKNDVLVIPYYLVERSTAENTTVEVIDEKGKIDRRAVTVGLLGTDSMVEVLSGLAEGDRIPFEAAK